MDVVLLFTAKVVGVVEVLLVTVWLVAANLFLNSYFPPEPVVELLVMPLLSLPRLSSAFVLVGHITPDS